MKRLFLITIFVLVFLLTFTLSASAAWYLGCDIPTGLETGVEYRVDNGNPATGLFQTSNDGQHLLIVNLTQGGYIDGQEYTFEARFTGNGLPPSGWSFPFVLGVLGSPVLRLVQQ